MINQFEKFDNKKCTLTKLSKHGESDVNAGHSVEGIFSSYADHIGLRASLVQTNGKVFITSDIQKVLDETDKTITFETITSVYKLEDNE